jgi:hypothetical protein
MVGFLKKEVMYNTVGRNEKMQMMKDYGSPRLSDDFFDQNPFKDISAARFLYSTLLSPGVEKLAMEFSRVFVRRGGKEAKRIRREKKPDNLLEMMKLQPDAINHWIIKKKVLRFSNLLVPKIIEELRDNQDDVFVESYDEISRFSLVEVDITRYGKFKGLLHEKLQAICAMRE